MLIYTKTGGMKARIGPLILLFFAFNGYSQEILSHIKKDSIQLPASTRYSSPTIFKKILLGNNYREVWAEPVTVAILKFSETPFKIKQLGGGQQTLSLRLEDKQGRDWVLRTVDKDITRLRVPPFIPKAVVIPLIQDLISAGFPYAAPVVHSLAMSTGIVTAEPFLYFIADDEALGEHRKVFAGKLCFLERREPTPDDSDTKSTGTVLENIIEESEKKVLQKEVLRARLLDMIVADWDRHADQWRWDKLDIGEEDLYYGIPRDRDQAFFLSNGLIVKMMQLVAMKQLVGFRKKLKLKSLNNKAWLFDRTFLNDLDENEWKRQAEDLRILMTDSIIDKSLRTLPAEVYGMTAPSFRNKLQMRRDALPREARKYYRHISSVVVVNGTEENDIFSFQTDNNGSLELTVKDAVSGRLIYKRSFDPSVTWKIIVNGLGGSNHFIMPSTAASSIRVEINGGSDKDTYQMKGMVRTVINDKASSADSFDLGGRVRKS
jgi:hypothetical protein